MTSKPSALVSVAAELVLRDLYVFAAASADSVVIVKEMAIPASRRRARARCTGKPNRLRRRPSFSSVALVALL